MDKKYKNINDSFDYKGIVFLETYEELISIQNKWMYEQKVSKQ